MKFRATIAAIGIAAALGITGAIVLPAAAFSARSVTTRKSSSWFVTRRTRTPRKRRTP